MMKQQFWQALTLGVVALLPLSSQASRTITDQTGRTVTIPDEVDRAVVLQHQTLNLLVQMNASDKIVGVIRYRDGSVIDTVRQVKEEV